MTIEQDIIISDPNKTLKGDPGDKGEQGDPGTTTWEGITDKPDILAFSGLSKISVGIGTPVNPGVGDLWIDTN